MSSIASIMSEFDDIEHLMYMNTYIEGKHIYDGIWGWGESSSPIGESRFLRNGTSNEPETSL